MSHRRSAGHILVFQDFPLHIASGNGDAKSVWRLLQSGHSPETRNHLGATPYQVAAGREVRDAFRRFRGQHPEKWNYKNSCIPTALTPEMEADKKTKKVKTLFPSAIGAVKHLAVHMRPPPASSHPLRLAP